MVNFVFSNSDEEACECLNKTSLVACFYEYALRYAPNKNMYVQVMETPILKELCNNWWFKNSKLTFIENTSDCKRPKYEIYKITLSEEYNSTSMWVLYYLLAIIIRSLSNSEYFLDLWKKDYSHKGYVNFHDEIHENYPSNMSRNINHLLSCTSSTPLTVKFLEWLDTPEGMNKILKDSFTYEYNSYYPVMKIPFKSYNNFPQTGFIKAIMEILNDKGV